jgi:hypothetical protein
MDEGEGREGKGQGGVFRGWEGEVDESEAMLVRSVMGLSMAVSNGDDKRQAEKRGQRTDGEMCLSPRRKEDGGGRKGLSEPWEKGRWLVGGEESPVEARDLLAFY